MRAFLFTVFLHSLPVFAGDYNDGIDLLYKQNRPEEALAAFQRALAVEGRDWSRPFMVGYTLKAYLKRNEEALPYLKRAVDLVKGQDEVAYREYVQCLEILGRTDDAIRENQASQAALQRAGKTPSAWFPENLAWLYYTKGDFERARRFAPPGSWVAGQLSDRTIEIDWRIKLTGLLDAWRLTDQKTLRLTLPVDRPYQKLKSVRITQGGSSLSWKRVQGRGNNFLEITRKGAAWPEEFRLLLTVEQNMRPVSRRPAGLAPAGEGEEVYPWASENADGLFSLDNPAFIEKMNRIAAPGRTTGEKADLLLRYLRANFKYGEKPDSGNTAEWLEFGSGDCGYFTFIAIAMLRSQGIPVRGLYGIGPWTDPPPALPHSILEIYDASSGQWLPHDPQSEALFGVINPSYVPFTAGNPRNEAAVLASDNVWEIDTVWFFWNGSGKDSISYNVKLKGQVASRSGIEPPATYRESGRGGPPPSAPGRR